MQNTIVLLAVMTASTSVVVTLPTVTTPAASVLAQDISPDNTTFVQDSTDATTTAPEATHTVEARQVFSPLPVLSKNVAFSVRKATESLNAIAHVHFLDVLTNDGAGWDPATSEFIAPYDGGYFFIFHAIGARTSDFTMALTRNGEYQVTAYGTGTSFEHGSNSVFLELRRSEKISLVLQQGSIYEHPANEAYTTFTGFLLFHL